ncbi:hypothetical protein D3C75_1213650 [compost metagenome]
MFHSSLMHSEDGGKAFPYEVELERPIQLMPDHTYDIKVFIDNSVCEIYINDQVAMSTRIYDIAEGKLGFFVSEGEAEFKDIQVHKLGKTRQS